MSMYSEMSNEKLREELVYAKARYNDFCSRNLKLDMSRGKPGSDQMDLSRGLFHQVSEEKDAGYKSTTGIDCRNYGNLDGLPELKELFGKILEVEPEQVIVAGNSSLNLMFDTIAQAMTHGLPCGDQDGKAWGKEEKVKFICPSPGYDRHFAICEYFGIEMITVANTSEGPDMDEVERLVSADPAIRGIWCVPKYSNPEGIVYSDEAVRRMAALKPLAKDFRIFWDNAYVVHGLSEKEDTLLGIYDACKKAGNEDMVFLFMSTSKITFPGAGVAAEAASPANIARLKKRMSFQTIGPDKMNQLRHARMFKTVESVKEHMQGHSKILRPKFKTVIDLLEKELSGLGIAHWSRPSGGYFISLDVEEGCAAEVGDLCREAGVVLTPAGATYPYGKDPLNKNIRIAPTFPPIDELSQACELLCVAVKLVSLKKRLG